MGLFSLPRRQTSASEAPSAAPDLAFKSSSTPELDIEKEDSLTSKEKEDAKYVDRAELIELTPMEALKWNVDGDESPFPEVQACVSTEDDESLEVNS